MRKNHNKIVYIKLVHLPYLEFYFSTYSANISTLPELNIYFGSDVVSGLSDV